MPDVQPRSALIVAVPEAAPVVDGWRERTCWAKPSIGVPPHVTIVFPFVPVIDERLVEELRALFGTLAPFTFELRTPARFPHVLYLEPEPTERFVAMVEAVSSAYPEFPPYEGVFATVVPHLTVAEGDDETLRTAHAEIARSLPLRGEVRDVLLIAEIERGGSWETSARLPLGAAVDL